MVACNGPSAMQQLRRWATLRGPGEYAGPRRRPLLRRQPVSLAREAGRQGPPPIAAACEAAATRMDCGPLSSELRGGRRRRRWRAAAEFEGGGGGGI